MTKKRGSYSHQELPHKWFWIAIILLFVVSVITILSLKTDSSFTGGAIVNIAFMKTGNEFFYEVRNVDGLKEMTVQIIKNVRQGKITVKQDNTIPFSGKAYSKFTIVSADAQKLGRTDFTLKVSRYKLQQLGISPTNLFLFVNGNKIPTVAVKSPSVLGFDKEFLYYHATLNQFQEGQYVIGEKRS